MVEPHDLSARRIAPSRPVVFVIVAALAGEREVIHARRTPRIFGMMCSTEKGRVASRIWLRQYSQQSPARSATALYSAAVTRPSLMFRRPDPQLLQERAERDPAQAGEVRQVLRARRVELLDLVRQPQQLLVLRGRQRTLLPTSDPRVVTIVDLGGKALIDRARQIRLVCRQAWRAALRVTSSSCFKNCSSSVWLSWSAALSSLAGEICASRRMKASGISFAEHSPRGLSASRPLVPAIELVAEAVAAWANRPRWAGKTPVVVDPAFVVRCVP